MVPGYVFETQDLFKICQACKKVYWRGTHKDRMTGELKTIFKVHADDD